MEISELGVFKLLDAVDSWQVGLNHHELTCSGGGGKCSNVKLVGKIVATSNAINVSGQADSKIVLECPKCGYIQNNVPDYVYQWYITTHMTHKISLGQVVEVEIDDGYGADDIFYGKDYNFQGRYGKPSEDVEGDQEIILRFIGNLRALVVGYSRDCDGTPLYCLSNIRVQYNSPHLPENVRGRLAETCAYKKWAEYLKTGFAEDDLKLIEGQVVPLKFNSIFEYEKDMVADL